MQITVTRMSIKMRRTTTARTIQTTTVTTGVVKEMGVKGVVKGVVE